MTSYSERACQSRRDRQNRGSFPRNASHRLSQRLELAKQKSAKNQRGGNVEAHGAGVCRVEWKQEPGPRKGASAGPGGIRATKEWSAVGASTQGEEKAGRGTGVLTCSMRESHDRTGVGGTSGQNPGGNGKAVCRAGG